MRNLLFVPTVHDPSETNNTALAASLRDPTARARYGIVRDMLWGPVFSRFSKLGEDFSGMKVFAEGFEKDSLPALTRTTPFSIAKKHYENEFMKSHGKANQARQTVLSLALYAAGATMVQVEDAQLLDHIHEELDNTLSIDSLRNLLYDKTARDLVLKNFVESMDLRDKNWDIKVPEIIDQSLQEDEEGILIVGAKHDVISYLPSDINVDFVSPEAKLIWQMAREGGLSPWVDEMNFSRLIELGKSSRGPEVI